MTAIPEVKCAGANIPTTVISTIVLGFAADPMARWAWPDSSEYLRIMPRFVMAFGGRAFEAWHSLHHRRNSCGRPMAASGVEPDEAAMGAVMGGALRPEIAQDIDTSSKNGRTTSSPRATLVSADHCRRSELDRPRPGTLLMKHALRRCDEEGVAAYLESSNPRNIPFITPRLQDSR